MCAMVISGAGADVRGQMPGEILDNTSGLTFRAERAQSVAVSTGNSIHHLSSTTTLRMAYLKTYRWYFDNIIVVIYYLHCSQTLAAHLRCTVPCYF